MIFRHILKWIILPVEVIRHYVDLGGPEGHAVWNNFTKCEVERAHLPACITAKKLGRVLLTTGYHRKALLSVAWYIEVWEWIQEVVFLLIDDPGGLSDIVHCFAPFSLQSFIDSITYFFFSPLVMMFSKLPNFIISYAFEFLCLPQYLMRWYLSYARL